MARRLAFAVSTGQYPFFLDYTPHFELNNPIKARGGQTGVMSYAQGAFIQ